MDARSTDEARHALEAIEQHHAAAIDAVLVPAWYWWVLAALSVGLGVAVDSGSHGIIVGAAVPYAVLVGALTVWMIVGRGRAQVSRELMNERGVLTMMVFIWAVVGGSLGIAFGLRAAGVGHPATIGTGVLAVALIGGGPLLMRRLRRLLLRAVR